MTGSHQSHSKDPFTLPLRTQSKGDNRMKNKVKKRVGGVLREDTPQDAIPHDQRTDGSDEYARRIIRETVNKFINPLIKAGRSEITITGYTEVLHRELWFLYENGLNFNPILIGEKEIDFLIKERWTGAPKYNHNRRTIVFNYLKYHRNEVVREYPSPRNSAQRVTIGPDKWLSDEEAVAYYNACQTPLEKYVAHCLLKWALRGHDMRSITIDDIYVGYVEVVGKGGRRDPVSFVGDSAKVLEDMFAYRRKVVEGIPNAPRDMLVYRIGSFRPRCGIYQKTAIDDIVRELGERAGIERRVTKHMLRRTGARMCLRSGSTEDEVSRMLRHKSKDTTRIYLGLQVDDLKPIAMRFDEYFNRKQEAFLNSAFSNAEKSASQ